MTTQCQRLLEYLQEHKEIEPLKAWRELGIYRLGARIFELRKDGHEIVSERKLVPNRFGEQCRIAFYRYEQQ